MNHAKPRILVVGAGSIGERHIRCFLQTGRAELVVCEPSSPVLHSVCSRYELAGAFSRLDDALQAIRLDAALIATPAHTHLHLAQRCAARGLHLLIEKPLAINLDGIDELRQTLDAHHRIAAVAYVWRCNPVWATLREQLVAQRWGLPLQLAFYCGQHFPAYRPAYRDIYYNSRKTGGGAILDAMSHGLNLGEWLAGPITQVIADADHLALPGVTVEDTVHVLARHGKAMASYCLNQHQHPNECAVQIVCTQGTVRAQLPNAHITWRTSPDGLEEEQSLGHIDRDTPFVNQAHNFLDVIEFDAKPLCSLAEGLQTQRVVNQVLASADSPPWRMI